jgi:hypothetical protein
MSFYQKKNTGIFWTKKALKFLRNLFHNILEKKIEIYFRMLIQLYICTLFFNVFCRPKISLIESLRVKLIFWGLTRGRERGPFDMGFLDNPNHTQFDPPVSQ